MVWVSCEGSTCVIFDDFCHIFKNMSREVLWGKKHKEGNSMIIVVVMHDSASIADIMMCLLALVILCNELNFFL